MIFKRAKYETRKDCIARSMALNITSGTDASNGYAEAVTCDIYSFHPGRASECVCFPIYQDRVTSYITTSPTRGLWTVTGKHYPPSELVESILWKAMFGGLPSTCTATSTDCPSRATLTTRPVASLGNFPYCPTTALLPTHGLARRTDIMQATPVATITSAPLTLPSKKPPQCKHGMGKSKRQECKISSCLWQYLEPYKTHAAHWDTYSDSYGQPLYATWNTTISNVTTPHWGTAKSLAGAASKKAKGPKWPQKTESALKDACYYGYNTSECNPASPTCSDQDSCIEHCGSVFDHETNVSRIIFIIAGVVTGIALLGMAWSCFKSWKERREDFKEYERRFGERNPPEDSQPESPQQETSEPEMQTHLRVEPGFRRSRQAFLSRDMVESPQTMSDDENKRKPGTMKKTMEEGRVLSKVRFTPSTVDVGMSSAHDAEVPGDQEGVRSRVSSAQ